MVPRFFLSFFSFSSLLFIYFLRVENGIGERGVGSPPPPDGTGTHCLGLPNLRETKTSPDAHMQAGRQTDGQTSKRASSPPQMRERERDRGRPSTLSESQGDTMSRGFGVRRSLNWSINQKIYCCRRTLNNRHNHDDRGGGGGWIFRFRWRARLPHAKPRLPGPLSFPAHSVSPSSTFSNFSSPAEALLPKPSCQSVKRAPGGRGGTNPESRGGR
ncbi:hypothetical protein LX32DRAFT_265789 [Colletotrichum zoysiae]|uniref:Secreted protein n=1 Tax=Colletotrichum zoysiae TaxID=1216348 RepID=A0AAD9LUR9_9PEZI|nr:hypothetical protein LX32DRAFT_265789 [Colletotrichum zoysiae]